MGLAKSYSPEVKVRYLRPSLRFHERLRRRIGAALTDGFFKGAASGSRYLPVAHPRVHGVELLRDLPYTTTHQRHHLLDVWRPVQRTSKLPVVLYLHGGGFRFL